MKYARPRVRRFCYSSHIVSRVSCLDPVTTRARGWLMEGVWAPQWTHDSNLSRHQQMLNRVSPFACTPCVGSFVYPMSRLNDAGGLMLPARRGSIEPTHEIGWWGGSPPHFGATPPQAVLRAALGACCICVRSARMGLAQAVACGVGVLLCLRVGCAAHVTAHWRRAAARQMLSLTPCAPCVCEGFYGSRCEAHGP